MNSRIALIGIILEEESSIKKMNEILHDYKDIIIGRMGLPHDGINIISIVLEADQDKISALSGKLGMLPGITSKTIYGKQK